MKKQLESRRRKSPLFLLLSIFLLIYTSYYYIAINENKINLTDGYWLTTCRGSLFPFPIDYGFYQFCGQALTSMSELDQLLQQIYIKSDLYVAVMLGSLILLAITMKKFLKEEKKKNFS